MTPRRSRYLLDTSSLLEIVKGMKGEQGAAANAGMKLLEMAKEGRVELFVPALAAHEILAGTKDHELKVSALAQLRILAYGAREYVRSSEMERELNEGASRAGKRAPSPDGRARHRIDCMIAAIAEVSKIGCLLSEDAGFEEIKTSGVGVMNLCALFSDDGDIFMTPPPSEDEPGADVIEMPEGVLNDSVEKMPAEELPEVEGEDPDEMTGPASQ
jgi:predicted nucleic acid-binding protein